jgi:hypothetical protein
VALSVLRDAHVAQDAAQDVFVKAYERLAQVRQRVAAVRAVVYQAEITGSERGQPLQLRIEGIQADDYGTRTDTYMGDELMSRSFALSGEKSFVTLYSWQEKYSVVALTEAIRRQNGDPKVMVEAFLRGSYQPLGCREIDGVVVEGVESRAVSLWAGFPGGGFIGYAGEGQMPGEVVGRLWVDVATRWPVEVTLDITDEESDVEITMVVRDFQWDTQVESDAFAAAIPEGYELLYKIEVGRLESGAQLVEGLAYFAESSGGRYPAQLTVRDILNEVGAIYKTLSANGAAVVQVDDDQIVNLKLGADYLGRLGAEGKEPAYYGATVTPADVDKVLVRWKLDDHQYRVIFGDLRIEDVSPQRLAELEVP